MDGEVAEIPNFWISLPLGCCTLELAASHRKGMLGKATREGCLAGDPIAGNLLDRVLGTVGCCALRELGA